MFWVWVLGVSKKILLGLTDILEDEGKILASTCKGLRTIVCVRYNFHR
jgi:hypothetical protein